MGDQIPILYSFRRCPYAMRARMAIAVSEQSCALREVVLRDKPPEMLEASPKGKVPVLVLPDGQVLDESYDIMRWALGLHDPDGWLAPMASVASAASAASDADEVLGLIAENDGPFKEHLDRYKYANRYEDEGADPIDHRTHGLKFIEKLDARLAEGAYLCGDRFTLADAAVAPFIRQFANTDRDWFDAQNLPGVQRWLDGILESDLFLHIMQKYPAWATGVDEPAFP